MTKQVKFMFGSKFQWEMLGYQVEWASYTLKLDGVEYVVTGFGTHYEVVRMHPDLPDETIYYGRSLKKAIDAAESDYETRFQKKNAKGNVVCVSDFPGDSAVNHPPHYNAYGIEVIDMMEAVFGKEKLMAFCELNAFKYRQRAGMKDSVEQDLAKERWYLEKLESLRDA